MSTIRIPSKTDQALIRETVLRAKAGDTLYYPKGHYKHPYAPVAAGVARRGDGIGATVVDYVGSIDPFATEGHVIDMTLGLIAKKAFRFASGAHDLALSRVRLRVPNGLEVIDACDYATHWDPAVAAVKANHGNFHDVILNDLEVEFTGNSLSTLLNCWWDCRKGGGNIYNITMERIHVGVKNAAGKFGQGRLGWLLQPSPPEHGPDGPRPSGKSVDYAFNWGRVDHGSGRAAIGGSGGSGFRLWDSNFVGPQTVTPPLPAQTDFDLCDYQRSWAMWFYRIPATGHTTAAQRAKAPDRMCSLGIDVRDTWFAGKLIQEYGRDVTLTNVTQNGGTSVYHVPDVVRTHDHQLYGV